jgi:hypothetical protein
MLPKRCISITKMRRLAVTHNVGLEVLTAVVLEFCFLGNNNCDLFHAVFLIG